MGFLGWLFGKKGPGAAPSEPQAPASRPDPAADPNLIRVFDGFGRELYITKQAWRDDVLRGNLEKMRDDPDRLYGLLAGALHDGFAADVLPYAEHLHRTDTTPARGAAILGIVYMETNRLDDAARVLEGFLATHGDDGTVLTNLAKVHARRGDHAPAEAALWHALEVDPNQANGLDWYAAIQRERGGEAAALDAYRRVAALPGSWRARLWLARDALERKDPAAAETLYEEALARAGRPAPPDLLMQMSGDLGRNGYLAEILRLVEPGFDAAIHGLQVGNNLIKANVDLARLEAAKRIVDRLYAEKRHDWQQALADWDTAIARAGVELRAKTPQGPLRVSLLSIEGPLWTRDGSPFAALLPAKRAGAPRVVFVGGTALLARAPDRPLVQLSDVPGRLSRAVPLLLAERVHLVTDAVGVAWIPWAEGHGFLLSGAPHEDRALCELAEKGAESSDVIAGITLDATRSAWKIDVGAVRPAERRRLAEASVEVTPDDPAPAVERLIEMVLELLGRHAGVRRIPAPDWYRVPSGQDRSDYLLRLEQQLAITCAHSDRAGEGGLFGEREMLDGGLQLCVRQPENATARMLFAQTLRQMKKVRPEILAEYEEKARLLQSDHPLAGEPAHRIEQAIAEALGERIH